MSKQCTAPDCTRPVFVPKNKIDVEPGTKYGKLTIIQEAEPFRQPSGQTTRAMLCRCDCGNEKVVRLIHLRKGRVVSCGCLSGEQHGMSNSPLYTVWRGMKNRCYTDTYIDYEHYKGKGITVCQEWRDSFTAFRDWALANGYQEGLEIDREDNSGNYEPSNCRFVPPVVNANNRDVTYRITYNGREVPLKQLLREKGMGDKEYGLIRGRIKRGWDHTKAVDTPARKGNYKDNFRKP